MSLQTVPSTHQPEQTTRVPALAHLNEIRLVCVKLPADVCPFSGPDHPRYLSIVFDEGQQPAVLGRELSGLPFLPHHESVSRACAQRAVLTVDGTLRVAGYRIEPDHYIRRWRQALAEAITVEQLRRHGLQVIAGFALDPGALTARLGWAKPPYPSLAALVAARTGPQPSQEAVAHPGWIGLSLDLAHPDAARDAWWLDDGLDARQCECRLHVDTLVTSVAAVAEETLS